MSTIGNLAFGAEIAAAAARHHLDPTLLAAVAAQETGGPGSDSGRNVVGDGGHGHGVFQIDDRYHPFAATKAAMDPARNADYAAGILAGALHATGGNVRRALSVYNAGSPTAAGTRTDWGDGRPVNYADSVLRHYGRLAHETQRADWRDGTASTNALATFAASAAVAPPAPAAAPSVAIAFPQSHATAPADRARAEQALALVDDGTDPDLVDPSRTGAPS